MSNSITDGLIYKVVKGGQLPTISQTLTIDNKKEDNLISLSCLTKRK